jgi:SAM-dependent methyltransferase
MVSIKYQNNICRICNFSGDSPVYIVREMMYGLRDEFDYFQCAKCQCLQIAEFPKDMSRYYQQDYYSLSQSPEKLYSNPIVTWARRKRDSSSILNEGIWGRLIRVFYPECLDMTSLSRLSLTRQKRIVDVGCGTGFLLYYLKEAGFENVLGLEPNIASDINYPNGLVIRKTRVHELEGEFDMFMFHHSFEHLPNPVETLESVYRLLPSDGMCIIRIPLVSSEAWERYRTDWVQLDAPRHFFLYSAKSLKILAEKTGFKIRKVVFDSTEIQFWGSEQYAKGIPLMAENSHAKYPDQSIFSEADLKNYKEWARKLNAESHGDQACFYLVKD